MKTRNKHVITGPVFSKSVTIILIVSNPAIDYKPQTFLILQPKFRDENY